MSGFLTPFVAFCLWALASMALAPLPLRYQIIPGLVLLLALFPLLIWTGMTYGVGPVLVGVVAAVSLFRRPLRVLGMRVLEWLRKVTGGLP